MLPDGYKHSYGDPGTLLPVHVHELDVVAVEDPATLQPTYLCKKNKY